MLFVLECAQLLEFKTIWKFWKCAVMDFVAIFGTCGNLKRLKNALLQNILK